MTIEIHRPELENLIIERLRDSTFDNVEDLLLDALRSVPAKQEESPSTKSHKTLLEFFRESPLVGVELDLERNKDGDRDIEL